MVAESIVLLVWLILATLGCIGSVIRTSTNPKLSLPVKMFVVGLTFVWALLIWWAGYGLINFAIGM